MCSRLVPRLTTVLLAIAAARADWEAVAPGFDYRQFQVAGPNNVFVVRMDRANPACTIDSLISHGRLVGDTETVSAMAAAQEDALGYWGEYWGQRYDVVAAINGDFYSGGVPVGGQICGAWYAKRFPDFAGGSGFAWQLDREAFIGECVRHLSHKQKISYLATGADQELDGVNRPRGTNELVLYTHHWDLTTGTDASGAEVLVAMTRPAAILPTPNGALGTIVEIRPDAGSTVVPFDHVVLSAHGTAAATLLANVSLGAELRISQEITHYEHDCSTPFAWDWTKTYASIGGSFHFLRQGALQDSNDPGATQRHPRTAIALNDQYIFFIVVDGRSSISVGMNMTELGQFCLAYLDAVEGLNQDGGGSSTLWVNGQVMNVPSDGQERPVANGMMMANVLPRMQSERFAAGDPVRAGAAAAVRVGPGANYAVRGTASAGTPGLVLDHALRGVQATGTNWWLCQFGALVGWVADAAILEGNCVGDYDGDGQIEAGDLPLLQFCLHGPGFTYTTGHLCLRGDSDSDRDVDLADAAIVQTCVSGP